MPDLAPVGANLIEGLGNYSMPVSRESNADVQRWFDQGLAIDLRLQPRRRRALVPESRGTRSGLRDVLVGRRARTRPARERGDGPARQPQGLGPAAARERTASGGARRRNRPSSKALAARYAENPPDDRRPLDEAYASAMGELAAKYPDDLDAVTLHAESLMDLQPWDYWDAAGQPKGHTAEVVSSSNR